LIIVIDFACDDAAFFKIMATDGYPTAERPSMVTQGYQQS